MMEVDQSTAAASFLEQAKQNIDVSFESEVTLPGDDVTASVTKFKKSIKIGDGLLHQGERVRCSKAGVLRYRAPATYFVESVGKRYIPTTGDHVVAMVEDKNGDYYRVNLLAGICAVMHQLAFDGATKRNKPELAKGDIVYARVVTALKDIEAEVVCTSSSAGGKEWTTGESVLGQLADGILVQVSLHMARRLLSPECVVLNCLAKHFAFEVAIGVNGIVWIKASKVQSSVVIRNAIINAASGKLTDLEIELMVDKLVLISKERMQEEL